MATPDLWTFALPALFVPLVWALLALSDRLLGRRGPRVWRGYHFRLREGRTGTVTAMPPATHFNLIRMAPKRRTKRIV